MIDWRTCPPAPLAWIPLRELLLGLVHTPALLLPPLSAPERNRLALRESAGTVLHWPQMRTHVLQFTVDPSGLWCRSSHHLNLRQTWRSLRSRPVGAAALICRVGSRPLLAS